MPAQLTSDLAPLDDEVIQDLYDTTIEGANALVATLLAVKGRGDRPSGHLLSAIDKADAQADVIADEMMRRNIY